MVLWVNLYQFFCNIRHSSGLARAIFTLRLSPAGVRNGLRRFGLLMVSVGGFNYPSHLEELLEGSDVIAIHSASDPGS